MAKSRASVNNYKGVNEISLQVNDRKQMLSIPAKTEGYGSSVSGGELLFLALATCYYHNIYREAGKRGIKVERVGVVVEGDFEREGEAACNVTYRARLKADASREDILDLMRHTDTVAEIQNTLRAATPVALSACEVIAQA